jgi:hypothetical protein
MLIKLAMVATRSTNVAAIATAERLEDDAKAATHSTKSVPNTTKRFQKKNMSPGPRKNARPPELRERAKNLTGTKSL